MNDSPQYRLRIPMPVLSASAQVDPEFARLEYPSNGMAA
jgi:hypothetical protein